MSNYQVDSVGISSTTGMSSGGRLPFRREGRSLSFEYFVLLLKALQTSDGSLCEVVIVRSSIGDWSILYIPAQGFAVGLFWVLRLTTEE